MICNKQLIASSATTETPSIMMGKIEKLNNYSCSSVCTSESGFTCNSAVPNVCTETCGDGKNMGYLTCDDGNTSDGDG